MRCTIDLFVLALHVISVTQIACTFVPSLSYPSTDRQRNICIKSRTWWLRTLSLHVVHDWMETPLTFDDDCYVTVKGQKYALIGIHEFAICALHLFRFYCHPIPIANGSRIWTSNCEVMLFLVSVVGTQLLLRRHWEVFSSFWNGNLKSLTHGFGTDITFGCFR